MIESTLEEIKENVRQILRELPPGVELVAAAKQQRPERYWRPSKPESV